KTKAHDNLTTRDQSLISTRKLAEAYFHGGSYALAMQECEVLLQHDPNAPEVLAMLGDIETRLQAAGQNVTGGGIKHGLIAKAMSGGDGGLVRLDRKDQESYNLHERGEEHLGKFLIVQQFLAEQDVTNSLVNLQQKTNNLPCQSMDIILMVELTG